MTAPREGDAIRASVAEATRAVVCLRLEVPEAVADDVQKKCAAVFRDTETLLAAHAEAEAERERYRELLQQGVEMAESLRLLVAERYPNHQHYLEADYRLGTLAAGFVHWRKAALAAPRATEEEGHRE